ncbi:hypothetical protein AB0G67_49035 [Streptomyces sp. NPDC021056]|uniref:hypothetical protein n=1 Tax=Streptomyces sp. NPDC021056 TaxID=3155012 RepID=UPI0033E17640
MAGVDDVLEERDDVRVGGAAFAGGGQDVLQQQDLAQDAGAYGEGDVYEAGGVRDALVGVGVVGGLCAARRSTRL